MSTFGTLRDQIEDELQRSDLSTQIAGAIKQAVDFYSRKRFWFNEGRWTISAVASQEYYGLPLIREVDVVTLWPTTSNHYTLNRRTWEWVEQNNSTTSYEGRPTDFCVYSTQLRLYPTPNDSYRIDLAGTRAFEELSATGDTNVFMEQAYELVKHRAKKKVLVDRIRGPEAIEEAMAQSELERQELVALFEETTLRRSTGKLQSDKAYRRATA